MSDDLYSPDVRYALDLLVRHCRHPIVRAVITEIESGSSPVVTLASALGIMAMLDRQLLRRRAVCETVNQA